MKRQPTQADYQKKVTKLRKLMQAAVEQYLKEKKVKAKRGVPAWTSAFLKVAWFGEGNANGWHSKMRLVLADGVTASIQTSYEIDELTHDIGAVKDLVFSDKWYGFLLTVYPDGKHQVALDHDPNCSNDPHWYET